VTDRQKVQPRQVESAIQLQGRILECVSLIGPASRLLDVGCSFGWLAPLARSKGVAAYSGVDLVDGRSQPPEEGVDFHVGSALDLPFPARSFDAVCLFDVVEHLPRDTEMTALREAHRVLIPGGHLYLSTPHASWLHTPLDPAWYFGHRHYRRRTVESMLRRAGFTTEKLFVAGGLAECLDYLRFLVYKHLLRRPMRRFAFWNRLIEGSHGRDHVIGLTIFAVASR
jgi:SAM-dependent methyltransferase